MASHFKYLLFLIGVLLGGCKEAQSQKTKNSLDIYLKKIDKEWHFVFKDTLDNFVFNPDRLQEYLALDSLNIPPNMKKNFQKVSNDSLQKLFEWTEKMPPTDSIITFQVNILRLGMDRDISHFFDIYVAIMEDCCMVQCERIPIPCDSYKGYLYTLHALTLNYKTQNFYSKRHVSGWEPLAHYYAKNKRFENLIHLWELRSKNGDVGTTLELFTLYYKGELEHYEKVPNLLDTTKAMKYLQIALEKNGARAFYELAEINMTKKDSINAFKNYITSYELFLKQFAKTPNNKPPYDNLMFSQLLGKLNYSFPKETELYKKEKKIKTL